DKSDFMALGKPNLFFGVTAGNMDSMINHYTADKRLRSDDAYTPGNINGKRPDRAVIVYSQRCREAWKDVPVVIGGIEASLRRIGHYDYWSESIRRSILIDSQADLLLYGNAERALVDITHRLSTGESVESIRDVRGTAFTIEQLPDGWVLIDSTRVDRPGAIDAYNNPYFSDEEVAAATGKPCQVNTDDTGETVLQFVPRSQLINRQRSVIRLPSWNKVSKDPVLYAHASRVLHLETNPHNARALVQRHDKQDVWVNPPPIPLTTEELDTVFELPYARVPHPKHQGQKIPSYEMIRFSINIMRGCFGGCTFCSITEHEGRIIQNRSEDSVIREIETIRDKVPGFTGFISDLGGPTANMYRLACKSPDIEKACRKPSCVYPGICSNLNTDHSSLIHLYQRAQKIPGVKKIAIASGLRYDLAVESPEYVKLLVSKHVGGYLKIAPEHTEQGPLSKMMKPGISTYERFKEMFEHYSKEAGKEQYLIPYFIAAHPGTTDEDMVELAVWLKKNGFKADQVQTFYPSPMATATAMYYSGKDPLKKVGYKSETVDTVKSLEQRRLHKALLRYHDPQNWQMIHDLLKSIGRMDLIGSKPDSLIPSKQDSSKKQSVGRSFATQHTGLPNFSKKKPGTKTRRPRV
nr:YgiQ family radical SAM protein [Gammaproteobacteria bacterium]